MRSSARRSQRPDSSAGAVAVLGNVILLLATLAVGGLAAYLVLNPPGVLEPASQQSSIPGIPGSETPPGTAVPTSAAPAPPPADPVEPAGQLTLGPACGAVSPLLTRADEVKDQALLDSNALNSQTISDLTRDLQALSDISPDELSILIDPLTAVLVELNNALLAGSENPELDSESAEAGSEAIRSLCGI